MPLVESLEMQHLVREEDDEDEEVIISRMGDEDVATTSHPPPAYLGVALATLSSFFFSLCSVIVKCMVHVHPTQLAVYRFLGILLPILPIFIYRKEPAFPKGKRLMLAIRSFVGATGLLLSFYSFQAMPLGNASAIVFSTPLFCFIFAYVFLREQYGILNVIVVMIGAIGMVLIANPTYVSPSHKEVVDKTHLWGILCALGATVLSANVYVILRFLKSLHFSVVMLNFGGFALVETFLAAWMSGSARWPGCADSDRWLILALAVCSFLGQILLTRALQMEKVGPVAIARTADIVFAFAWQVILFREVPTFKSAFGALIIISCILVTGVRNWLQPVIIKHIPLVGS